MGIFAVIYFRGLQNLTMRQYSTVCLHGHFRGDLFSQISLSCKNRESKLVLVNWYRQKFLINGQNINKSLLMYIYNY